MRDAEIMGDLLVTHAYQGKDQLADSIALERFELSKRMFGNAHRLTLASIADLTALYMGQPHQNQEG